MKKKSANPAHWLNLLKKAYPFIRDVSKEGCKSMHPNEKVKGVGTYLTN
jgi:hypothetical protein